MGKRTKTFEEKQRPFTAAEAEALKHLKNSGKKSKNEIMTPEKLELQDTVGDAELKLQEGILITPDMLAKEEEDLKQEAQRFSEEFKKQLNEWINEDHHSEYEGIEFDYDDYLVRVFNMDVTGFSNFITLEYEWSTLLKNFKLKDRPATENAFPIVKILKKGKGIKSELHNVGDVVLVPSTDIIGEDWNPQFLHVMQYQQSSGMKPVLPEGMRQSIPNVEKNWGRYKFVRPWVPVPEPVDQLTYLIPETKVRGRFNSFK